MSVCCTDTLRATRGGQPSELISMLGIDLHKRFKRVRSTAVEADVERDAHEPRRGSRRGARGVHVSAPVAVEATTPTWSFVDQIIGDIGSVCVVRYAQDEAKAAMRRKPIGLDAQRLADALRREGVVVSTSTPTNSRLRRLCRHRLMLTQLRSSACCDACVRSLLHQPRRSAGSATPQCRRSTMARRHRVAAASAGARSPPCGLSSGESAGPRARRSGGAP